MTTAIDTNALIAILYADDHADASERALRRAYSEGPLVVAPIVYAELAADGHFESAADLDRFLEDFSIAVEGLSRAALYRSGEAFRRYADRRPSGLQCPTCGDRRTVECEQCGSTLRPRQHVAADFLIGGHAERDASGLVSFDRAFFETYFPGLDVRPDPT